MKLLLDTHTVIWALEGDSRLSESATAALNDTENQFWLSHASAWEMAIKISLGKLALSVSLKDFLEVHLPEVGVQVMPIGAAHIIGVMSLPFQHRDPFDRLLVSQCVAEGLGIVSADGIFDKYGISRVW